MPRKLCPYLGLKDDPTTALHFPSEGNACHHARPVSGIRAAHQENFCLSDGHLQCPVFQAAAPIPLPQDIAAPAAPTPTRSKRRVSGVAIPLMIVGAAAASFAWNALQARANTPPGSIVNTGGNQQAPSWSVFTGTAVPRSTATTASRTIPPLTNCPLPDGWMPYLVAPTDSLYRLSIIYGVPVANLQRVNCMDDSTTILPGQIIYVPVLPTSTPSLTPSLVPAAPVVAPPDSGGSEKPRPTPRPPTAVPVPPTPVPPTAVVPPPPKDDPTPRAKPTKKPKDSGNSGSNASEEDPPGKKKKDNKGKNK